MFLTSQAIVTITFVVSVSRSVTSPPDYQLANLILMGIYVFLTLVVVVGAIGSVFITRASLEASAKQSQDALAASERHSQATINAVNEQIAASEALFQQERFTEHRPLLIPEGAPKFQSVKPLFLNWTTNEQRISIHNVGPGVALNVASVLYGESYNTLSDDARTYIYWTCWLGVPVAAGLVMKAVHKLGRGLFDEETMLIGSYTLNAPEPERNLTLPNTLARITITYFDIFRRKHASIVNYVETDGWQLVEFLEDIPQDLHDLQFEASNG